VKDATSLPSSIVYCDVAIAINVQWAGRRVFGRADLVKKNESKGRISLGRVRSRSSRVMHDRLAKIRLPRFPELFDGSAVYEQAQADGDELFQELARPTAFIFGLLKRRRSFRDAPTCSELKAPAQISPA